MKTFLILGAGTAGSLMAREMSRKLDMNEWKVILVDKDDNHLYQPGYLFLPFGIYKPQGRGQTKTQVHPPQCRFYYLRY